MTSQIQDPITSNWPSTSSQPELFSDTVVTTSSTIETTTGLNCGFTCSPFLYNKPVTKLTYDSLTPEQREVLKEEYYKSYDYMTGLRTAASLGGTILLFSLFVLYKMKCRQGKNQAKGISSTLEGKCLSETDIEKDAGLSSGNQGVNTVLLMPDKPPNAIVANNFGSRRSSKAALSPDEFPIPSRTRFNSMTTTPSPSNDGHRFFEDLQSRPVTPLTHLPKSMPRFVANDDYEQELCPKFLRPDFLVEPIDIHIIQPTPNVSPCGSIRRLSEDVGAMLERRAKASSASSSALIPLLALPKSHHSKPKYKAKMLQSDNGTSPLGLPQLLLSPDSACGGDLCGFPSAVPTTPPVSRRSLRRLSGNSLNIKYIDCSDSDGISMSSDSDAVGAFDSDIGSPPSPKSWNLIPDLLCNLQITNQSQIISGLNEGLSSSLPPFSDSKPTDGQQSQTESVSETKC